MVNLTFPARWCLPTWRGPWTSACYWRRSRLTSGANLSPGAFTQCSTCRWGNSYQVKTGKMSRCYLFCLTLFFAPENMVSQKGKYSSNHPIFFSHLEGVPQPQVLGIYDHHTYEPLTSTRMILHVTAPSSHFFNHYKWKKRTWMTMSLPGKTCSFFHCNRQEISFGEMITSSADFSGSCKRWGLVAYNNPICSMYRLYTRCLLGGYWVVLSNIFYFHHYLWKISNFTHIFQMDWKLKAPNNLGYIIPTTYYTPVIEHSNGTWTLWRCISYSKWGYSSQLC